MTRSAGASGPARRAMAAWLLGALLVGGGLSPGVAEDPAAEVARSLQGLGAPGLLWGRIAVEEESPEGPSTPLAGVEVTVYPYAPGVAADLDRIREQARISGADYDAALKRLRERLGAWEAETHKATGTGAAGGDGGPVRRQTTDRWGVFAFPDLPSGEWLVVALHTSPYSEGRERGGARRPTRRGKEGAFLPRSTQPAKRAEVWVTRVRLGPRERARVFLTDRARFMVGPIR